jgi:hypothetical protein
LPGEPLENRVKLIVHSAVDNLTILSIALHAKLSTRIITQPNFPVQQKSALVKIVTSLEA